MSDVPAEISRALLSKVVQSRGHVVYESGHHGDVWLDLNELFVEAIAVRAWAREIARRARGCGANVVCGPMVGGALLAQFVAAELEVDFVFAEQIGAGTDETSYRVPASLRPRLRGARVLLIDDVVNAGSAWDATLSDVLECGARPVGFGTLITMGTAAESIARRQGAPLIALAELERNLWAPDLCPLCRAGVPLSFGLLRRET